MIEEARGHLPSLLDKFPNLVACEFYKFTHLKKTFIFFNVFYSIFKLFSRLAVFYLKSYLHSWDFPVFCVFYDIVYIHFTFENEFIFLVIS